MNDVTIEQAPTPEAAEAQAEAVETASDAAVDIAEIQADAALAIAIDNNDTAVELAELENDEDDLLWLRGQLDELRLLLVTQGDRLSQMEASCLSMLSNQERLLTLIPPVEPIPEAEMEAVIVTEPEAASVVEDAPEVRERPRRRWLA